MHPLYREFVSLLDQEDKEKCVNFVISRLSKGELDVVTLYDEILAPALNNIACTFEDTDKCVWKEHVKSAIVRTIIECCYPYVIRERDGKYGGKKGEKVLVVCPVEEFHELGAKMVTDFFTLCGYDATFVGANTPGMNIVAAVADAKPKYLAISVSNYYNIVAAEKAIAKIREAGHRDMKIIVGGNAFRKNPDEYRRIGADMLLQTFDDVRNLRGGGSR